MLLRAVAQTTIMKSLSDEVIAQRCTSRFKQPSAAPCGVSLRTPSQRRPFMKPERMDVYSRNASVKGGVGSFVAQGLAAGNSEMWPTLRCSSTGRVEQAARTYGTSVPKSQHHQDVAPGAAIPLMTLSCRRRLPAFSPHIRCAAMSRRFMCGSLSCNCCAQLAYAFSAPKLLLLLVLCTSSVQQSAATA